MTDRGGPPPQRSNCQPSRDPFRREHPVSPPLPFAICHRLSLRSALHLAPKLNPKTPRRIPRREETNKGGGRANRTTCSSRTVSAHPAFLPERLHHGMLNS